jgi:hypothetical protein
MHTVINPSTRKLEYSRGNLDIQEESRTFENQDLAFKKNTLLKYFLGFLI